MDHAVENSFQKVPANSRGHFVLYFYAAVFRFLNHIIQFSEPGSSELEALFKDYPFFTAVLQRDAAISAAGYTGAGCK